MIHRISELLPDLDRPVIIGEIPYYRADPRHWARIVQDAATAGIDVVSCYIPWRFHEVRDDVVDLHGQTDPQRDVAGFLDLVAAAGLRAIVKPGPFVHGEVQLGGLPDRLCDPVVHTPAVGLDGRWLASQGQPLPSLWPDAALGAVAAWIGAVSADVILPRLAPAGPIVGVQLGNEGIYSEVNQPVTRQDASEPARRAFAGWLTENGSPDLATAAVDDCANWPPSLRVRWSQWCGHAIVQQWQWLADLLPAAVARVVNVPLARVAGPTAALDGWASRQQAVHDAGFVVGHTEWVGNAATDTTAFASHVAGIRLGLTDTLEANWGFTWTDMRFAEPGTALFHALLGLLLGSSSCSVYTACATNSWGERIDLDPDALLREGIDPELYAPPYCPGAPLTEVGAPGSTLPALRVLRRFLDRHGCDLSDTELVCDATLYVDSEIAHQASWSDTGDTALSRVAQGIYAILTEDGRLVDLARTGDSRPRSTTPATAATARLTVDESVPTVEEIAGFVRRLLSDGAPGQPTVSGTGGLAVIRRTNSARELEFVGLFNPGERPATARCARDRFTVEVEPAAAVVIVMRGDRELGRVDTAFCTLPDKRESEPQRAGEAATWLK